MPLHCCLLQPYVCMILLFSPYSSELWLRGPYSQPLSVGMFLNGNRCLQLASAVHLLSLSLQFCCGTNATFASFPMEWGGIPCSLRRHLCPAQEMCPGSSICSFTHSALVAELLVLFSFLVRADRSASEMEGVVPPHWHVPAWGQGLKECAILSSCSKETQAPCSLQTWQVTMLFSNSHLF